MTLKINSYVCVIKQDNDKISKCELSNTVNSKIRMFSSNVYKDCYKPNLIYILTNWSFPIGTLKCDNNHNCIRELTKSISISNKRNCGNF